MPSPATVELYKSSTPRTTGVTRLHVLYSGRKHIVGVLNGDKRRRSNRRFRGHNAAVGHSTEGVDVHATLGVDILAGDVIRLSAGCRSVIANANLTLSRSRELFTREVSTAFVAVSSLCHGERFAPSRWNVGIVVKLGSVALTSSNSQSRFRHGIAFGVVTLSPLTNPKPAEVDCKLLIA